MTYPKTHQCQIKNLPQIYLDYFGYITNGSFVEIGAFNCYNWSNTYGLAQVGWRGLLVEPQAECIAACQELYKDNPRITLEQCCIGRKVGKVTLYLGGSTTTIKRGMINTYNSIDNLKFGGLSKDNSVICDMLTLDALFEKHHWLTNFEVLVIDVEGAELDVLAGFTLDKWLPQMVIIETHEQHQDKRLSGKAAKVDRYFRDYKKIYSDHINSIYVR